MKTIKIIFILITHFIRSPYAFKVLLVEHLKAEKEINQISAICNVNQEYRETLMSIARLYAELKITDQVEFIQKVKNHICRGIDEDKSLKLVVEEMTQRIEKKRTR